MNMAELLTRGGPVVWVLVAYSAVGLAIVLERMLLFLRQRGLPRPLRERLPRLLEQPAELVAGDTGQGPESRIVEALVVADAQGVDDLRSVGNRVRGQELQRMEFRRAARWMPRPWPGASGRR
jgi:biopolymer transport protein ExbB